MKDFILRLWHITLIPGFMLAVLTAWLLQLVWPADQAIKRIVIFSIVWNVIIYGGVLIYVITLIV